MYSVHRKISKYTVQIKMLNDVSNLFCPGARKALTEGEFAWGTTRKQKLRTWIIIDKLIADTKSLIFLEWVEEVNFLDPEISS